MESTNSDAHRAAALLAEWDAMMAEVYEYVATDRARRGLETEKSDGNENLL